MKVDYLIIGQGLAGSVLAMELLQRGKRILVVDGNEGITSSKVAAGIINPVTGRRFVKTWRAETLIPTAKTWYQQLEQQLDKRFFYSMPIFRLFGSVREQNDALARAGEEGMDKWLEEGELPESYGSYVHQDFGGIYIHNGGWLNLPAFQAAVRQYLTNNELLLSAEFDYDKIDIKDRKVCYDDIIADHVIFCEGSATLANPYWYWLPFVPAKGELFTLYHDNFPDDIILNRHSFLLPLGDGYFRFGATYEWDDLTTEPTKEGKEELWERMQKYIDASFEIVDHRAAVRPTVKDRRPIIGHHPQHENLWLFNGLGTKGVLLAPYFARQLVRHIEEGESIDEDVSVDRFAHPYGNAPS